MKRRTALVSEEETKSAKRVRKLLKHVSRLCTGKNKTDKHKHLSSSLRRGFCTSVLFIVHAGVTYRPGIYEFHSMHTCSNSSNISSNWHDRGGQL